MDLRRKSQRTHTKAAHTSAAHAILLDTVTRPGYLRAWLPGWLAGRSPLALTHRHVAVQAAGLRDVGHGGRGGVPRDDVDHVHVADLALLHRGLEAAERRVEPARGWRD
jgi:hypothetical protein